jgi:hypothetical protein
VLTACFLVSRSYSWRDFLAHIGSVSSGFLGADGLNPIHAELRVGDADRQWWEPAYLADPSHRLGKLERFVPAGPDEPQALLDACLAFYAAPFRSLPSFAAVESELEETTFLDFDAEPQRVPKSWGKLRAEARSIFERLPIMEGTFRFVREVSI